MKFEFSQQILEKYSNLRFHEKPSSDSRVVPCEQMEGRTDCVHIVKLRSNPECGRISVLSPQTLQRANPRPRGD